MTIQKTDDLYCPHGVFKLSGCVLCIEMRSSDLQLVADTIPRVWDYIGHDVLALEEQGKEVTNEAAVECCIDANRLKTSGHPLAEAALDRLLSEHEYAYPDLLNELCGRIQLV